MGLVLETERLLVHELDPADLHFVALMLGDPATMRFWPRPYTQGEAAQWIDRHRERYAADKCGYWLLSLRDRTPIGQVGVLRQEFDAPWLGSGPHWGLGYILHHPFWGNGYATEAAQACLEWAFRELETPSVVALIRPENEPSLKVATRLGMIDTGLIEYFDLPHRVFAKRIEREAER